MTVLCDAFPSTVSRHRMLVTGVICVAAFVLGLPFVFQVSLVGQAAIQAVTAQQKRRTDWRRMNRLGERGGRGEERERERERERESDLCEPW